MRIINKPPVLRVRWFLYHPDKGYLENATDTFADTPDNVLYFDGFEDSDEQEIKETFEMFTNIPLDEFECVGMYEPDEGWGWD